MFWDKKLEHGPAETLALLSQGNRHLRLEQERIEWLWAAAQLANALDRA